jgi:hypothetical protein
MIGSGPQTAFRLDAEYCIQRFQNRKQAVDIRSLTRVHYVDIERVHRSAVKDRGESADQDEVDTARLEGAQHRRWFIFRHSTHE